MLSGLFFEYKEDYEELKDYSIRMKKVSFIYHQVFIENEKNMIRIDLEQYGDILGGVLFYKKSSNTYYYTLADLSYIKGSKDVFSYVTSIEKEDFYKEARSNFFIRHFKRKLYNYNLVHLIYNLIEEFIKL